jgi:hypothetical protein
MTRNQSLPFGGRAKNYPGIQDHVNDISTTESAAMTPMNGVGRQDRRIGGLHIRDIPAIRGSFPPVAAL